LLAAGALAAQVLAEPSGPVAGGPGAASPKVIAVDDAGRGDLSGPKVSPQASAPTIVVRDSAGLLVRPEGMSPAEAAFRALNLSDEQRAAGEKILAERAKEMDALVSEHILDIVKLASAFQSGDNVGGLRELQKLWGASKALRERGLLAQQLAKSLPSEQGEQLLAIVRQYMQAVIEEERQKAKDKGTTFRQGQAITAEGLRGVGQEVKASYERVLGQKGKDFDQLIKDIGLDPQQESRLRAMVAEATSKYGAKIPQRETTRIFLAVYRDATPEQRRKLMERVVGRK
jgi:hypothetical protein